MNFENYQRILDELKPYSAQLIAVSKTKPQHAILELYNHGQRHFGENKVQEMVAKQAQLPYDIQWHLIGHLQSNKVKYVAPFVTMIHSVDSLKLLQEIDRQAQKNNRVIDCLLQIHIAREETKYGLAPDELHQILNTGEIGLLQNIRICGFMGMATLTHNQSLIEDEFAGLKTLFDEIKEKYFEPVSYFRHLSMGMSSDYPIALRHGATFVRVGSLLFGDRG